MEPGSELEKKPSLADIVEELQKQKKQQEGGAEGDAAGEAVETQVTSSWERAQNLLW